MRLNDFPDKAMNWVGSSSSLIVHTILFVGGFALVFFGFHFDKILLVITTAVSLEAIYLAIFIQIAVNRNTASLGEVEENIDEIQEDIQDMEKDIDEIQEDESEEEGRDRQNKQVLDKIENQLQNLINEIEKIKNAGR